jgi:hypothetical protein
MKIKNIKISTPAGLIFISVITIIVSAAILIYSKITLQQRIKNAEEYMAATTAWSIPCDSSCQDKVTLKNGEELHGIVIFEYKKSIDFAEAKDEVIIFVRTIAKNDILVLKKETVVKTLTETDTTCFAIIDELWKNWKTFQQSKIYFVELNGKDPTSKFMTKISARYGRSFFPASEFQYNIEHNTKISISLSKLPNGIVAASFSNWSGYDDAFGGVYLFKIEKGRWKKLGFGNNWIT